MSRQIKINNVNKRNNKRERYNFSSMGFSAAGETTKNLISTIRSAPTRYTVTRNSIQNAIDSRDIAELRNISDYFYSASGAYRRLVDYYGSILTNDYIIIPHVEPEDIESSTFLRSFERVQEYAQSSNIKNTCQQISLSVVKNGAYFGYEREIDKEIVFQELPAKYCRTRFMIKGIHAVEFDFAYFDAIPLADREFILSTFPEEFNQKYTAYLGDRQNLKWQFLDFEKARAHILGSQVPMLAPIFLDLLELEDYKKIDKARSSLDIYKLLIQKIPLNKDGEIDLYMEEIEELHRNARQMVSNTNVDVITTPCDFNDINLSDRAAVARDDVQKATNAIYSTAGTSTVLFSDGARSTAAGLNASVKVDESFMSPLLSQYENWYNYRLKSLASGRKIKFTISFPIITHFNRKDMMDLYVKGATLGFPTKLLTMAALGLDQFNTEHLINYENNILKLHETMIPTSSAYNPTTGDNPEGGRPESEEPLSDEGEATKEQEKNEN